jgi:hypothetical protein
LGRKQIQMEPSASVDDGVSSSPEALTLEPQ